MVLLCFNGSCWVFLKDLGGALGVLGVLSRFWGHSEVLLFLAFGGVSII